MTLRRLFARFALATIGLALVAFIAFEVSPWPRVLLIRHVFDEGAATASSALEKHVPADITSVLNERDAARDDDALLDAFFPADAEKQAQALPTIVWNHGGGVSGDHRQIDN